MSLKQAFHLPLPKSGNTAETVSVTGSGAFVIVGANGSGKTRLGTWLDIYSPIKKVVHRVSAQKSLTMPASVSPGSLVDAESQLLFGYARAGGDPAYKIGHRWSNNPSTALLSDYEVLMRYLFSEDYEKSIQYRRNAFEEANRVQPPQTKLDIVKNIWESVLPHRKLLIGSGSISTTPTGRDTPYSGSEMSDGERVNFYLIGETISVPEGGVVVIDEPELHLHRAIQSRLWDAIESERPDLTFVYITHDLGFAASREGSTKICVRGFDGQNWDWYESPASTELPEEVLLLVLGSRKPVLFIEGEEGSIDFSLLRQIYPDATLVPVGGCTQVVNAVASFSSLRALHHLKCFGLVDRDYRDPGRIQYLQERAVYVLPKAEIENTLVSESVLRVIGADLQRTDIDRVVEEIKGMVLERLANERERVISEMCIARIEERFIDFDAKARGLTQIREAVNSLDLGHTAEVQYAAVENEVARVLQEHDYEGALSIYSNKGLTSLAGTRLGLQGKEYIPYIKRLLASERRLPIIDALRPQFPIIPWD